MKVLIIANARWKDGMSGGDAIHLSFEKYWDASVRVQSMMNIDYKPFTICYIHRIILACFIAIIEPQKFDVVYSASDFLMDSIPAFIHKLKGNRWVAGYFLESFKSNPLHYYTQKVVKRLIKKYADMVIVTNQTMLHHFPDKKITYINGGIDLKLCGKPKSKKVYDVVFVGRLHPSKGIDELIRIWGLVKKKRKKAKMAVIGDGDLGRYYIRKQLIKNYGSMMDVELLGFMGEERFEVYNESKMVVYPTPKEYEHFSVAPVEAMACGLPLVTFNTPVICEIDPAGTSLASTEEEFADDIIYMIKYGNQRNTMGREAKKWAKQYGYEAQAKRVYKSIKKELGV